MMSPIKIIEDTVKAMVTKLEPLFLEYRVDMVLGGHVHSYTRVCPMASWKCVEKGGITYITVGTGGATIHNEALVESYEEKYLKAWRVSLTPNLP